MSELVDSGPRAPSPMEQALDDTTATPVVTQDSNSHHPGETSQDDIEITSVELPTPAPSSSIESPQLSTSKAIEITQVDVAPIASDVAAAVGAVSSSSISGKKQSKTRKHPLNASMAFSSIVVQRDSVREHGIGRLVQWRWMIRMNRSIAFQRFQMLLGLLFVALQAAGIAGRLSFGLALLYYLFFFAFVSCFLLINLVSFDRSLVFELIKSWEWMFLVGNTLASNVGWLWSGDGTQFLVLVIDQTIFFLACVLFLSLDAAPTFRTTIKVGFLLLLLATSARVFIQDYLSGGTHFGSNVLCVYSISGEDENHSRCLSSRSMLFSGHFTLFVFFAKYLAQLMHNGIVGKISRASLLKMSLSAELVPVDPNGPRAIITEDGYQPSIELTTLQKSNQNDATPKSSIVAATNTTTTVPSSAVVVPVLTSSHVPSDSTILPPPGHHYLTDDTTMQSLMQDLEVHVRTEERPGFVHMESRHHLIPANKKEELESIHKFTPVLHSDLITRLAKTRTLVVVTVIYFAASVLFATFNTYDNTGFQVVLGMIWIGITTAFCSLELVQMDRQLLGKLLRSFDWWFLTLQLLAHIFVATFSYLVPSSDSDGLPVLNHLMSAAIYLIVILLITTFDAVTAMPPRFKQIFAGACVLNTIKIYVQALFQKGQYPAHIIDLFFYKLNTHDVSLSTFTTVSFFILRYFVQLLQHPHRLVILKVSVVHCLNPVQVDQSRPRRGRRHVIEVGSVDGNDPTHVGRTHNAAMKEQPQQTVSPLVTVVEDPLDGNPLHANEQVATDSETKNIADSFNTNSEDAL